MDWKISPKEDADYFVVTTTGDYHSGERKKEVAEILSQEGWRPDTNALFGSGELNFNGAEFAGIYAASATHEANDQQIGSGKTANVVARPSDLGLICQF